MLIEIQNEELRLLPQKAVFWKKYDMLLLADLHLGKVNHFRKSGYAVPSKANDHNVELLVEIISLAKPKRVVCLGDLFHSYYNPEWEVFGELVNHFSGISFELVLGNHDVMSDRQYERKRIYLHDELRLGPFIFTHHPMENIPEDGYNLAGHIHPGIVLTGKGRQSLKLPCFYFGARQGLLPAFGKFTGLATIYPQKEDKIFVVADDKVISVA
jgi:uncharacterized protein